MKFVTIWLNEIMLPTVSVVVSIWAFAVLMQIMNDLYRFVCSF